MHEFDKNNEGHEAPRGAPAPQHGNAPGKRPRTSALGPREGAPVQRMEAPASQTPRAGRGGEDWNDVVFRPDRFQQPSPGQVVQRSDDPESGGKESSSEESVDRGTITLPMAVFQSLQPNQFARDSSANIVKAVQPLLAGYLTRVHYNSLEDAGAFADHLDKKRESKEETTAQEAFDDFSYDSTASIRKANGAQCVGQGIHFAQQVMSQTKYPCYPCAAKFAGKEYFGHGAALIAFANPKDEQDAGYILLDPGFNVADPVVVTKALPGQVRSFVYQLEDSGEIKSYSKETLKVTFPPQEILNPDAAITNSALLAYDKFRVVARGDNIPVVLELDLRGKKLDVRVKKKKKSADIEDAEAVKALITDTVAEALGYKPENTEVDGSASERLLETLFKVIRAREDIVGLQDSKLSGKQETEELD